MMINITCRSPRFGSITRGRRWQQLHLSHRLSASSFPAETSPQKYSIVFLGTPDVAASVLTTLHRASSSPGSTFHLSAVVSQPGKPKGRGNKTTPVPTPVEEAARSLGLPQDSILCPSSAKDEAFLSRMRELKPDLCITAAYGNILPQRFLDIPRLGTLNIHPSLLPKYRGAAPVQRAMQDGCPRSGVSVAYTVLKCDAGPILAQQEVEIDPEIQAPELLAQLFDVGARLLLDKLDNVFQGRGGDLAWPQDESQVVHAAKLTKEEGRLNLRSSTAQELHDKVRAFAGWPGTSLSFVIESTESQGDEGLVGTTDREEVEIKIIQTSIPIATSDRSTMAGHQATSKEDSASEEAPSSSPLSQEFVPREVRWSQDGLAMILPCLGDGGNGEGELRVSRLQPPTKKAITAAEFKNGLRKKRLLVNF